MTLPLISSRRRRFFPRVNHAPKLMLLGLSLLAVSVDSRSATMQPDRDTPGAVVAADAAIERARAAVRRMMDRGNIPGVSVAVWRRGTLVWAEGFGYADVAARTAVTPATSFGFGSISKLFATALAARVAERGALDWDRPVEFYFPEFPHRGRGITVRMLASHLSGLSDEFDAAHASTTEHYERADQIAAEISRPALLAEPGTTSAYCTGAFTVLAAAIERASGASFREALQSEVLRPLDLRSVEPRPRNPGAVPLAKYYVHDAEDRIVEAAGFDPSYKLAGAGLVGTASDLVAFAGALNSPGFLGAEQLGELFTPQRTRAGEATAFGLGWSVGARSGFGYKWIIGPDDPPHRIVHHPGGGPGISCWLVLDRDAGLAVAVLSNLTGAPVGGRDFDEIMAAFSPAAGLRE